MSGKPPLRAVTGGKREDEAGLTRAEIMSLDVVADLIEKKKAMRRMYEARGAAQFKAEIDALAEEARPALSSQGGNGLT